MSEEIKTMVEEEEKEFIIPMNDKPSEELTEDEKKFLNELDEKYKDRNDYADTPIIAEASDVMIDPNDGHTIVNELGTLSTVKVDENSADVVEMIMNQGTKEITDLPSNEKLTKEMKDIYDMDDKDIIEMIYILRRMQNKEKFSVYNALPDKLKNLVMLAMSSNSIPNTLENRNVVARAMIDDMLNDIKNDDTFIEFNQALKEIIDMPSVIDFHSENYKDIMENKLIEFAERCKDEKPEVSKSLISISETWKDTYSFVRQHQFLDNSESARNSVTKNIDEVYKNMVRDFTYKIEKSKYIINDVNIMLRVLNKFYGEEYPERVYKAFICTFISVCGGLDINKPSEIVFIYYSIKNIIALEFTNKDSLLDFNKELTDNIKKLLDRISELDSIYQEKIKNGTNKRAKRKMERLNKKKGGK